MNTKKMVNTTLRQNALLFPILTVILPFFCLSRSLCSILFLCARFCVSVCLSLSLAVFLSLSGRPCLLFFLRSDTVSTVQLSCSASHSNHISVSTPTCFLNRQCLQLFPSFRFCLLLTVFLSLSFFLFLFLFSFLAPLVFSIGSVSNFEQRLEHIQLEEMKRSRRRLFR